MSDETIEIDEPVTVEDWQNVAEGFFLSAKGWHKRAEAAEAEIERLTAIVQRVEALRKKWSLDRGVLSVSLHSAECQLGRALRGESDE